MERNSKSMDGNSQYDIDVILSNLCHVNQMPPHILGETLRTESKINIETGRDMKSHGL